MGASYQPKYIEVISATSGNHYIITEYKNDYYACSCPDFRFRSAKQEDGCYKCKHIQSYLAPETNGDETIIIVA